MKSLGVSLMTATVGEYEFGRTVTLDIAFRLPKKPRKGVRFWVVESIGKPEWKDGKLSGTFTLARYDSKGKRAP